MCLMITYNSDTEKMSINKILSAQQIGEADSATIAYERKAEQPSHAAARGENS